MVKGNFQTSGAAVEPIVLKFVAHIKDIVTSACFSPIAGGLLTIFTIYIYTIYTVYIIFIRIYPGKNCHV